MDGEYTAQAAANSRASTLNGALYRWRPCYIGISKRISGAGLPVIPLVADRDTAAISAAGTEYSLAEADVGKPVPVLYQEKFEVVLVPDYTEAIRQYVHSTKIMLWDLFR